MISFLRLTIFPICSGSLVMLLANKLNSFRLIMLHMLSGSSLSWFLSIFNIWSSVKSPILSGSYLMVQLLILISYSLVSSHTYLLKVDNLELSLISNFSSSLKLMIPSISWKLLKSILEGAYPSSRLWGFRSMRSKRCHWDSCWRIIFSLSYACFFRNPRLSSWDLSSQAQWNDFVSISTPIFIACSYLSRITKLKNSEPSYQ